MRRLRYVIPVVLAMVAGTVGSAGAANAMPDFQAPFPCDQEIRMESFGHPREWLVGF